MSVTTKKTDKMSFNEAEKAVRIVRYDKNGENPFVIFLSFHDGEYIWRTNNKSIRGQGTLRQACEALGGPYVENPTASSANGFSIAEYEYINSKI